MRRCVLFCIVLVSVIGFTSCDNEIDLVSDWKSIPVVYGLINAQDTAHYIRVEKAFIDANVSGPELAKIPDSLYYDDILVQIERTGSSEDTYTLNRVDGNLEGFVREDGLFAESPNYLYKLKLAAAEKFQGNDIIKLVLKIGENQEVTAETVVTSQYELVTPDATPPNQLVREIGFLPGNMANTRWRDDEETSAVFDINYYIHYRERADDDSAFEQKLIKWELVQGLDELGSSNSSNSFTFPSNEFFQILEQNIQVIGSATRRIDSIDVEIIGAGQEVLDYLAIGQANTGITSSQVIPTFSNLSEGRGIFSSSTTVFETGFRISDRTQDSLEVNVFTQDLNFR